MNYPTYKLTVKPLIALRKHIEKHYGKPCKCFMFTCPNCRAWYALSMLEEVMEV